MKRILFIDDSDDALQLANNIADNGFDVYSVDNLCDAEYLIMHEPGADNFDIIILDLGMRVADLPLELQDEARRSYAGWVFYAQIIYKYPNLFTRTIIYTGYGQDFVSKIDPEKRKFAYFLDKNSTNIVQRALSLLNELSGDA
jgi:Response regulator containing CheY-like receiver, AAA-type ATPase, and DNA-binding domains